jgi:hypothetical protein
MNTPPDATLAALRREFPGYRVWLEPASGMSQSPPPPLAAAAELARWREAWRLRRAHPRWVVFWAADASQYGAYRLSRARRDTVLSASTPEALAALIKQAEQTETRRRLR